MLKEKLSFVPWSKFNRAQRHLKPPSEIISTMRLVIRSLCSLSFHPHSAQNSAQNSAWKHERRRLIWRLTFLFFFFKMQHFVVCLLWNMRHNEEFTSLDIYFTSQCVYISNMTQRQKEVHVEHHFILQLHTQYLIIILTFRSDIIYFNISIKK